MTRTIVKVDRTNQLNLLNDSPPVVSQKMKKEADTGRTFIAPNRKELFLGMTRMDHHLRQAGLLEPLEVAALLEQLTWHEFEARYAKTGRAPYAPQAMMGVILYGFMQGIHSLRGLERLARQDLGCMWITGGICPDHACLGRFILLHEASFSNGLFKSITRQALALRIPTFIFSTWFPIEEGLTPQTTFFLLFHNERFSGSFWLNSNKTILASLLSYLIGNDDDNLASQPLSQ